MLNSRADDEEAYADGLLAAAFTTWDEYGQPIDPYSAWVQVWRNELASTLAVELIVNDDDYFGALSPTRVNMAVMVLTEVLQSAMTRRGEWFNGPGQHSYAERVNWLTGCVRLLADHDVNTCWDRLTGEHRSWLVVTAATA